MKDNLILIGGGEHCESCIDVIEQSNKFNIVGIVDLPEKLDQFVFGYKVFAADEDLKSLAKEYKYYLITVGHIRTPYPRIKLYNRLKDLNVILPVVTAPSSIISKHATLGEGSVVLHNSIIDVNAKVGNNCIINHSSVIGHYAKVEDHCHISANCVIGRCFIETGTFIGGNSWVNNGISIAKYCVVGSGSNVIKNITDENSIFAGNPAKRIN